MSALEFITFKNWEEMTNLQQVVVAGLLRGRMRAVLENGHHTFGAVDELLERIGVEHLTTGQIMMRRFNEKTFCMSAPGPFFKMSIRRFASLVHGMDGVRIEQFSHEAVARDGMPRIRLIIS